MKSFLAKTYRKFFNDNVQGDDVSSRKRKRFDESDIETFDDDVVITAVKRPRLTTTDTGGQQIPFFSYLYNPYQKMSDWVKNKCSWSDIFSFRKMDGNDRSKWNRQGNAHPNGQPTLNRPMSSSMNPPYQPSGSKKVSFLNSTISTQTDNEISSLNGDNFTEDSISECGSISRGTQYRHPKGSLFDIKTIKPKFTATEYVRLDEKERYRQLLKQFTDVPMESSKQQTQQNRERSNLYTGTIKNESILGSSIKIDLNQSSQPSKEKVTARPAPKDSCVLIQRHSTPINRTLNNSYARQQLAAKSRKESEISTIICDDTSNKGAKHKRNKKRVPSAEFKDSKFIHEDWLTDLTFLKRKTEAENLEKELRHRMRIFEKEPPVVEDLPGDLGKRLGFQNNVRIGKLVKLSIALTDDMLEKITDALRPNPPDQVLVEGFKLQVTRKDIATLGGLNWLNDEIINFYMNMLTERGEKEGYPKVYSFNTFFYPKLLSGGHSAVKRWTRRVDTIQNV
ncbi:hypothetical protein KUTeg_011186 [Tegillarca granosa]|uniref:Ubiquitin-like protease family profile domain-containing protein n=1 Tax=Tegillarca granosa TaxID=220873 RepID=A0ABQ9F5T4_TEGGR|nr:hypothetical protein KUTeg_011186 [Tegillarca granosa]